MRAPGERNALAAVTVALLLLLAIVGPALAAPVRSAHTGAPDVQKGTLNVG